ncbi:ORF107 [Plodia interpunctella granulovirus]|uniref:ORF107 n=1 Tax=Plodia interpunctella granulovirus TaxID=262175 RepID=A0A1L5JGS4_9BBAC|nr:ORF107 [Plodia interpunctella granulovirus]APO13991.1 ORF107 [Plodia interpunctella granulovirus]
MNKDTSTGKNTSTTIRMGRVIEKTVEKSYHKKDPWYTTQNGNTWYRRHNTKTW